MTALAVEPNAECIVRDGTVLRSDIYHPRGQTELPTLVCRTPHGKTSERYIELAEALARMGYCVVVQDHRGRFASEGEYEWMFQHRDSTGDGLDGYDTIEWAARLPSSNGDVGAFGHSNDGWSVWMLLAQQPPSLAQRTNHREGRRPHPQCHECVFGGVDLTTLYITSAIPTGDKASEAGGLFAVEVDTPGVVANPYRE